MKIELLLENKSTNFCLAIEIHISFHFSGQPPAEADLNLLETARRCELYGTKMHPAKVNKFSNQHQNLFSYSYILIDTFL